jgi:phenylpropionate dioxygenase-like ring-hydroxylating dioxygenase large terminal subunit
MVSEGADPQTGAVRQGERAYYYWIYPNFMINCYGGVMDTNLVIPHGVDRTEVIFDFYFADVSAAAQPRNRESIEVSHRIQLEDLGVCVSVQRGLRSRAYGSGRLSVRREAGEHLFHRLLHGDLVAGSWQPDHGACPQAVVGRVSPPGAPAVGAAIGNRTEPRRRMRPWRHPTYGRRR